MNRDTAKIRIALAVCVFFIAGTLLSAVFVATHSNHEHDHSGPEGSCTACAYLAASVNLLKVLSVALVSAALGFKALPATLSPLKSIVFHRDFFTLVSLKIRLNY